ncbi:MAG: hypothetical protein WAV40_02475 [Microgenomates group bacterium]
MNPEIGKADYSRTANLSITRLLGDSEFKYYFNGMGTYGYQPNLSSIEDFLPPGQLKLADYFEKREIEFKYLKEMLEYLDFSDRDVREKLSIPFINRLAANSLSGNISQQEILNMFAFYRTAWSDYWPDEVLEHKMRNVFEPSRSYQMPYKKHISLENAYFQSELAKNQGLRTVTVMGTFDFHSGHSELLNAARELAGNGLVTAFITSDEEALVIRTGQNNILNFNQRCDMVAGHVGVDFCVGLPWDDSYKDVEVFDAHMKELHMEVGAHFRLVGELDERSEKIRAQCNSAGTILVYRAKDRIGDLSSTGLRKKLNS